MMMPTIHEEHIIDDDPMAIPFYPFGEALVKNKTRRRTKSDYVYEALFYICMFALVLAVIYNDMYVYQPKITDRQSIYTTITNLTIDELSLWIPQALASIVIGQAIAWAMLYFSGRLLDRFPSLVLILDSATLVFFILFSYRTPVNVTVDWGTRLGHTIATLAVVASFILLPTTQRVVAHLRATLGVMMADHLPVFGLGCWKMMMPSPKIKTTREIFEAYQAPRWWFFLMRILAWTTFLRLTLLLWFFADRIIHLSNYDDFFDCYETAGLFIIVLTMCAFELRIGLLMVIFLIRRNKNFSKNRLAR